MSPAEGLKAILIADGVIAGASGWTWELGSLRDLSKSIALVDTGGRGGEAKVAIDYPTVQILLLGEKNSGGYTACRAKADEIYASLHGVNTPNASYSNLASCIAMGNPVWLGADGQGRPRFALNFRLIVVPDNAGDRDYV